MRSTILIRTGPSFISLLLLLLIGLKVAGISSMSWLWVLAPIWFLPALVLLVGAGALLVWTLMYLWQKKKQCSLCSS